MRKGWSAGRINAKPSIELANFFKHQNFKMLRLKTGTPARLNSNSIDFDKCIKQKETKILSLFHF